MILKKGGKKRCTNAITNITDKAMNTVTNLALNIPTNAARTGKAHIVGTAKAAAMVNTAQRTHKVTNAKDAAAAAGEKGWGGVTATVIKAETPK